jgi:hypothetical protein
MGAYSNWQVEQFERLLKELVLKGEEAGVPWISDSLRAMADKLDSDAEAASQEWFRTRTPPR